MPASNARSKKPDTVLPSPAALALLQQRADEVAGLLKALANPDRLLLLCQLVDTELSVSELGERTGLTQPSLSQQLGVLRNEGLVATRRDGKAVHYRIAAPEPLAVLRTLCALYGGKPKRRRAASAKAALPAGAFTRAAAPAPVAASASASASASAFPRSRARTARTRP